MGFVCPVDPQLFFLIHLPSLSPPVPPPLVSISLNPSGPLYSGTTLTISCIVTLDSSVDNDETVSTHWSGLDHIVPPERYSVTPAMRGSDGGYTGTLTISPLAEGDDGTLSCTGTVTGGTESQSANSTNITVAGKYSIVRVYTFLDLCMLFFSPQTCQTQ